MNRSNKIEQFFRGALAAVFFIGVTMWLVNGWIENGQDNAEQAFFRRD